MLTVSVELWCSEPTCGGKSQMLVRISDFAGYLELPHTPDPNSYQPGSMGVPGGWQIIPAAAGKPAYCLCPIHAVPA